MIISFGFNSELKIHRMETCATTRLMKANSGSRAR